MTAAPPNDLLFWAQPIAQGEAAQLAASAYRLVGRGWNVLLAWGGDDPPRAENGLTIAQLTPEACWRADQPGMILDAAGEPANHAWKKQRAASLLSLFARTRPAVILLDRFPFGQKAFRYELRPLLEMATRRRPRPHITSLSTVDDTAEPAMRDLIDQTISDVAALQPP